jgi:hypothetical protein
VPRHPALTSLPHLRLGAARLTSCLTNGCSVAATNRKPVRVAWIKEPNQDLSDVLPIVGPPSLSWGGPNHLALPLDSAVGGYHGVDESLDFG